MTNDSGPAHFLNLPETVGDDPSPSTELCWFGAFVGNPHRVREDVALREWKRLIGNVLAANDDANSLSDGD